MTADRQGTTFRCDHAADPATPLLSPNIDFSAPWEVPTWLVFEGLRPIGPFTDCAEVPPSKSGHLATLGASSALLELPSPEYPQNPAFPLNGDVSAPCEVQAWVVFEGLCPIGPFTNWTKLPSPKTDYWATLGASNVPIGHAPGVAVPPRHYDNWNNWNNWCKWYSWFHTTSNLIWDSLSNFIQLWLKILCNVHVSLSRSVAIAAALDDLLGMRACLAHAMRSSNPNGWDDTQSPYLLGGWARCGYLCHFNMMDHRHLLILTVGAPVRTTIVTAKAFLLCTILSSADMPADGSADASIMAPRREAYMSMVGAFLWLSNMTRPEVAHIVSQLARFISNPGTPHWNAAVRVLNYFRCTPNQCLLFCPNSESKFHVFVDSSWASKFSCSGALFFMFGCPFHWFAKTQRSVTLSSAEAEFFGAMMAARDLLWVRDLLVDLGFVFDGPTIVYIDSKSAVDMSVDPVAFKNTKHILRAAEFLRDIVLREVAYLKHLPGRYMLADLLTKNVSRQVFRTLMDLLAAYSRDGVAFHDPA